MERGFTLIELVLVLVIMGALAALYTASTGDLSDVSVDAASRKVQSDLRYAHQLAVGSGVNHGAVFISGGGYQVYREIPGNYVADPVTHEDMVVDISDFAGVSITTDRQIEFDPTGTPVMGGDARVRLAATSGAIRDVYVIKNTGAVIVDLVEYGTGCSCELCGSGI